MSETVGRIRAQHGAKLLRFGAVSAFNVILGQALLFGAQVVLGWAPLAANTFSLCVGAIPAYYLSRHWVWEKRGSHQLMREVIPFWTLAILGFVVSTTAIWYVDTHWDPTPLMVNLTSLISYGLVWVAKFLIFDRIVFKSDEQAVVV
jgi:putative flippase GtrA